ncbi:MAG: aminotransferase class I/II-fold pyridoxal phosphate-dependent enzyme, partial [Muribaculaceae bacterium]|nr:aminotransferase class I/II-fold pyridoxal phosphate-dependent enzyme [Muribaculaceae bacterium]
PQPQPQPMPQPQPQPQPAAPAQPQQPEKRWLNIDSEECEYLDEAQRLRSMLNEIEGIEAFASMTNFFLCTIAHVTARELKEYLAHKHGILIRDASNFTGLTPHHFRIAAQSPEANDALVEAIKQFTSSWRSV